MATELEKTSSVFDSNIPDLTTPETAYKTNSEIVSEYFTFKQGFEND